MIALSVGVCFHFHLSNLFDLQCQGNPFSPLLFVLTIKPLIKIMKKVGDRVEVLYYMDDLKASMTDIETAEQVDSMVKTYAQFVGVVINHKKSAIQLDVETQHRLSLREIP